MGGARLHVCHVRGRTGPENKVATCISAARAWEAGSSGTHEDQGTHDVFHLNVHFCVVFACAGAVALRLCGGVQAERAHSVRSARTART